MILNRLLITAALMLFSMTLTAQKTYLPLTVGTDTIGFFEGNAFDPYKKKYLFKSTQADKFVESHPDLDFEWSTNEQTYELKLKWNPSVIFSLAYSQDLFEYDKGTFTRNGERLEMYQIDDFTVFHKVGRSNVRRGINFDEMHKNMYRRGVNNSVNLLGGAATGFCGGFGVWLSSILIYDEYLSAAAIVIGPTTVLCAVSLNAFSRIASKDMCLPRRDKQFNKVADKLNEAIQSSNQ